MSETSRRRCPHTGIARPECSCRACCEALVARYAPWLLTAPSEWVVDGEAERRPVCAAAPVGEGL